MSDSSSSQLSLQHLNTAGCVIEVTKKKERRVYASKPIPKNTTIEISPALLFSKTEYENHGKYTVLDDYTFVWPDGRTALALGLGSIFNHSDSPNVSFTLNTSTDSICYTTTRDVESSEELCISIGHKARFPPAEVNEESDTTEMPLVTQSNRRWSDLSTFNLNEQILPLANPFKNGDATELMSEEDLPFVRYKLPPEEEEPGTVRTIQAWVVDVPDQRLITAILKWLRQVNLDTPELAHLKRVRKQNNTITFLLTTHLAYPTAPPELPEDFNLPPPYLSTVPASSALTPIQFTLKMALWPTIYTPHRKDEVEKWSRGKAAWAWQAMQRTVQAAIEVNQNGEYPIAAHVPAPYEEASFMGTIGQEHLRKTPTEFTAHDTRKTANHPLRHAVINTIREIADFVAATSKLSTDNREPASLSQGKDINGAISRQNGSNYLLTSMTLFTTHEPCVMCSMALLHSRVKEVIYLYPMTQTGGCGSLTCLSVLKGVNHRYSICCWKQNSTCGIFASATGKGIPGHIANERITKSGGILDIEATIDA